MKGFLATSPVTIMILIVIISEALEPLLFECYLNKCTTL